MNNNTAIVLAVVAIAAVGVVVVMRNKSSSSSQPQANAYLPPTPTQPAQSVGSSASGGGDLVGSLLNAAPAVIGAVSELGDVFGWNN